MDTMIAAYQRIASTLPLALALTFGVDAGAQVQRERFDFEFAGVELSGVLDFPEQSVPEGIVLIVHGDGRTDAVAGDWWGDVRAAVNAAGYATYMWDKPGCGGSGGDYEPGRDVDDEAGEVIAAIERVRARDIAGAQTIGLWGISRAGWINPLVIGRVPAVAFWISVSGVSGEESFKYLLAQNLRLAGHPPDSVDLLVREWHDGLLLSRGGASFRYYEAATPRLRADPFWRRLTGGAVDSVAYYAYQRQLQARPLDRETDLPLYVPRFDSVLAAVEVPVLALFGETDRTVNWRRTKRLYEATLNREGHLSTHVFPDCNHNMWRAETGGLFEAERAGWTYVRCDGFLASMTAWLEGLE